VVLQGRGLKILDEEAKWYVGDPRAKEGYDSHESPCGLEWAVFSSAQILPLYVLHLHYRADLPVEGFWLDTGLLQAD